MSLDPYAPVAVEQLTALHDGPDVDLYNAVLDVIDVVLAQPGIAQSMSSAILADGEVIMRLPVPGHHPFKVFWTTDGPTIRAVFPYTR